MPYCEKCGEKLDAAQVFCSNCGSRVDNLNAFASKQSQPVDNTVLESHEPYKEPAKPRRNKSKKGILVACLSAVVVIAVVVALILVLGNKGGENKAPVVRIPSDATPVEAVNILTENLVESAKYKLANEKEVLPQILSTDCTLSVSLDDVNIPSMGAYASVFSELLKTVTIDAGVYADTSKGELLLDLALLNDGTDLINETFTLTEEGIGVYNQAAGEYIIMSWNDMHINNSISGAFGAQMDIEFIYDDLKNIISELFVDDAVSVKKDVEVNIDGEKVVCDKYTVALNEENLSAMLNALADYVETDEELFALMNSFSGNDKLYKDDMKVAADELRYEISWICDYLTSSQIGIDIYEKDSAVVQLIIGSDQVSLGYVKYDNYLRLYYDATTYSGQAFELVADGKDEDTGICTIRYSDGYYTDFTIEIVYDYDANDLTLLGIPYGVYSIELKEGFDELDGAKFIATVEKEGKGSKYTLNVRNFHVDDVSINDASIILTSTGKDTASDWPDVAPTYGDRYGDEFQEVLSAGLSNKLMNLLSMFGA
ncbi:MAG: zinc ribbon domain-containing protein [Eubacteriales bacterium]|nr:zinc ribbon domain-containing protein [Eubacteriales bacterium]